MPAILQPVPIFVLLIAASGWLGFLDARFLPDTAHARRAHELFRRRYDVAPASTNLLLAALVLAGLPLMADGIVQFTGPAALGMLLWAFLVRDRAWVRAGQAVPIS